MEEKPEEREYIVYLETDVTVRRAATLKEAEKIAEAFVQAVAFSPLVSIDETRIITSEVRHYVNPTARQRRARALKRRLGE